jgi:hypothetical protein
VLLSAILDITRLTKRGLDQYTVIQLFDIGGDAQRRHSVEHAKRVTALKQLMCITFMQCAEGEEDYVVDHVGVSCSGQLQVLNGA